MKKILLPLVCLLASVHLFADEFRTTTMLSKPVGIFDSMIVTGPTTLGETEIGAISRDSAGFLQDQTLIVHGIFGLLTPISVGGVTVDLPKQPAANAKILINRSLVLKSGLDASNPIAYTFNNISVHPSRFLVVAGNMELNEINVQTIETAETFANVTGGEITTLTAAPTASYYNIGGRRMDSPRSFGKTTAWTDVQATMGDEYGPWSAPQDNTGSGDTCKGNNINTAYTCGNVTGDEEVGECIDYRRITIDNYYSLTDRVDKSDDTTGGAMVFNVIGRKEGHYAGNQESGNSCYLDVEYTVKDSQGNPIPACQNLGTAKIVEGANLGQLCYAVCLNNNTGCSSERVCYDANSPTQIGKKVNTGRTAWLDGSKLECHEMWEEVSFPAIRCGPGAGAPACGAAGASCTRYQWRRVKCNKLESGNSIIPGTFLTLDY